MNSQMDGLPPKFRNQVLATGPASMKHPERLEDYLEHIAEAIAASDQLPSIC